MVEDGCDDSAVDVDSLPRLVASDEPESGDSTCSEAGDDVRVTDRDPLLGVPLPVGSSREEKCDAQFAHMKAARSLIDQITPPIEAPPRIADIASHVADLGPSGTRRLRRKRMALVRRLARALRKESDRLIACADDHVASVLRAAGPGGVHVALIERLLKDLDYEDSSSLAADLLTGFDLIGEIRVAPNAVECMVRDFEHTREHVDSRAEYLAEKFVEKQSAAAADDDDRELRQDIFRQTVADQKNPARIGPFRAPKVAGRRIAPPTRRFGVRQMSSAGTRKIRCIDDFAASLVNGLVRVMRRIRMGRISDVLGTAATISGRSGRKMLLLKSDFKAAYRCCPISKAHLQYADILVQDPVSGDVLEATQFAMPFGAVAAVYAWDRLGEAIVRIIEYVLVVAVGRYVDDLFMADFEQTADELRSLLLELVSLLGLTLEESKTPSPADTLEILGVEIALDYLRVAGGFTLSAGLAVGPSKRQFWASLIGDTLQAGTIPYRDLEKLVGRLVFASSAAWGPLARGHLTSLFALLARGGGQVDVDSVLLARGDLQWWQSWLLEARVVSVVPRVIDLPHAIIYSDAEGTGGIGAVLILDGQCQWFAGKVPNMITSRLKQRKTQIFPFEVAAATAALVKWGELIQGRRVAFFVDNIAARGALAAGRSSQPDVNGIIGIAWQCVVRFRLATFFLWVPSLLNISDGPSRGDEIVWCPRAPLDIRWESIAKRIH